MPPSFDRLLEGLTELTPAEGRHVVRYVAAVQGGPAVGAFNETLARAVLGRFRPALRQALVAYVGRLCSRERFASTSPVCSR
jgi:hypothetical protein